MSAFTSLKVSAFTSLKVLSTIRANRGSSESHECLHSDGRVASEVAPSLIGANRVGGLPSALLHDFDGAEYLVHHLGDDGVAVGFEGFGAPLSERKGKAVHIKGKPIISSVNRGDRREVLPAFCWSEAFSIRATASGKVSPYMHPLPSFTTPGFVFPFQSLADGVGNIPDPAIADRLCPIWLFGL